MPSQPNDSSNHKNTSKHEDGAIAAWCTIGGAILGALVGCIFHKALIGAILLGVAGWIVGGLIERAKR